MATEYSAQAAKGPGSWGFEGPEAMKPAVRRGMPLRATKAGTSRIDGAGTSEGPGSWGFEGPEPMVRKVRGKKVSIVLEAKPH